MTFEQLIRQNLMDVLHAKLPAIGLDASGEPNTARVIVSGRKFDKSDHRQYRLAASGDPKVLPIATVTADVTVSAELQIHSAAQSDIEALLTELLEFDSLIWAWRGYDIRVDRELKSTKIVDAKTTLRETVQVDFSAPYLKITNLPVIADASWFDGWTYTVEDANG